MASVAGQAFGRFGYEAPWDVPGLKLDKTGFRVDHPAADRFAFAGELRQWKPLVTTDTSQTVSCTEFVGAPSKLRHDLLSPGVAMYFPQGFRFRLSTTTAPMLTWSEGSLDANTNYATPAAPWVIVSFRDQQPPLMLAFLSEAPGVRLTGRPGEWTVSSDGTWAGWLRVVAPLGSRAFPTLGAADLGRMLQAVRPILTAATQPAPIITGFRVVEDGLSLTAEWTFDRAGVVVPSPVFFAGIGGYNIQPTTPITTTGIQTAQGPLQLTGEAKLALRATARRIPTGRALALGPVTEVPISTASYLDAPSVVELALTNLMAHTDKVFRELAEKTVAEFLSETSYHTEPATQQKLPFDGPGGGLDLTAAHALLFQTTLSTVRATSEPNSLLTTMTWRRDWLTWQIWAADIDRRRRAAALTALAAAISPEPERRWEGVMLQAGLAAERGMVIWRRRSAPSLPPPNLLETLFDLREDLFGRQDYRRPPGFGALLGGELRAYGDVGLQLLQAGLEFRIQFTAGDTRPVSFSLASAFPIDIRPGKDVVSAQVTQAFGVTVVRAVPRDAGICELMITWPEWAAKLPPWSAPPRFTEVHR